MKKLLFLTITIGLFYGVSCFASGGYKLTNIFNNNIDTFTGDSPRTTSGYFAGTNNKYYVIVEASSVSAEFDTAEKRTGNKTLMFSNTDITGKGSVFTGGNSLHSIRVKSNNYYSFSLYAKTNNVALNSVFLTIIEYSTIGGSSILSSSSNKISGTNDWTLLSKTLITSSKTNYLYLYFKNNVAGNISDAWFDINSMTITSPLKSKVLNRY